MARLRIGLMVCGAMALTGAALPAQRLDTVSTRDVAPGVVYRHLVAPAGPLNINVVTVDLRHPGIHIGLLRADDSLSGRERVSAMVHRHSGDSLRIVAAINGDFFNLGTGRNEDNEILAGEVWHAVSLTDAPQEHSRSVRSQFAVSFTGQPLIDRFVFAGMVIVPGAPPAALDAINGRPDSNDLVLFTARWGPRLSGEWPAGRPRELPLTPLASHGDTMRFAIAEAATIGPVRLAPHAVLVGTGTRAAAIDSIGRAGVGAVVSIVPRFIPDRGPLAILIGGWARLVRHGVGVADSADVLEGTQPSFSVTKHPRTGIGFSRDSSVLTLITVDGRQESSSGVSLVEFADLMRSIGIAEGLNLDGGGSTTMVIGDSVVNHPSDAGGERAVGNALVIEVPRRP
jgi:Phosphodiester glycosidase